MSSAATGGAELASYFDHTLLKPESTFTDIVRLCGEAKQYHFATVCVNPYWVPDAAELLKGSDVGITTVIGFPLGATSTLAKMNEARDAIAAGATEIDMVLNVGALKSGRLEEVVKDIRGVVDSCKGRALVKVILEVGLLTDDEKVKACELCKLAGADYVKTSTGFGPGGATVADIALMRKTVGPEMGVKASGGVRDLATVRSLIAAGATRVGASSSVAIVSGAQGEGY
ncbi:deoxyribose-phosphate aldolase [Paenibacillus baekrokdamisoli]|uniref:Deoxyribose-phosphate aldolase n=1 Tax=Paenibacillus baekrokdamisoli TaxID=1712516 RepID=A0A3G9JGX3_9BACL|nr:deoxyribose-phosphate aldolase [Paenibacillus baekrokdamisoli]MBB3070811.1 deoxyribose-phosphate aldolase [Paenibacillus baekrokdamisoli]BBH22249.1 deoxyribose-phosphate aldolase [Paenibacillus baekrokdamisoli]